jgi:hypothetical protein
MPLSCGIEHGAREISIVKLCALKVRIRKIRTIKPLKYNSPPFFYSTRLLELCSASLNGYQKSVLFLDNISSAMIAAKLFCKENRSSLGQTWHGHPKENQIR